MVDAKGVVIFVNAALVKMLGYDREEELLGPCAGGFPQGAARGCTARCSKGSGKKPEC